MLIIHLALIVCTLKLVNTVNTATKCNFNAFKFGCDEKTNTVCDNLTKVCVCKLDFQYDNVTNKCIYKVIGSACKHHFKCQNFVSNSECNKGVCICKTSHYNLNDSCHPRKNFHEFCSNDFECKPDLYCGQLSRCKCRKNYEFNELSSECRYKYLSEVDVLSAPNTNTNLWNDVFKVGGFVVIVVFMLILCTKKESEQNQTSNNDNSVRRRSTSLSRAHRRRSSSVNSHRPLTQTSSNASRVSAYRTFEENRQTIVIPMPSEMVRSMSSSDDEIEYNPYIFDTLFPQQSDNDDPPSYEEAIKETDNH